MLGNLKIYAPRHDKEVYEASLPFYKEDQDDKFWLAFCIKGGHGINGEGVTVSDPTSISSDKPDVIRDCSLNPVSQPSSKTFDNKNRYYFCDLSCSFLKKM